MKRLQDALVTTLVILAAVGCGGPIPEETALDALSLEETGTVQQRSSAEEGRELFTHGTFQGNGRKCVTCHTLATGTLSPADVLARGLGDPIFRPMDSDEGLGLLYTKLLTRATVTVNIPLPPNVSLALNPSARSITLRRGIPSTLDTPALDPVLMADGREPSLQSQARSAILGHAQAKRAPSADEADSIAKFEKTLFSSEALRAYANGGPAPALPAGNTASEQRGRAFFEPTGLCGSCHGGPLLNTATEFNPAGLPAGARFATAGTSELNLGLNPINLFVVTQPDGTQTTVSSPDPGLMLITGKATDANLFKMVSLRNLKNTAPYFHDNSAQTIEQVVLQYTLVFATLGTPLSPQDALDISAYLKLL